MISLKLISLLGIILGIFGVAESANMTDACIKKSPSIKINHPEKSILPSADRRSLLFIFDATGSMQKSLEEFKKGAQEIVKEYSSRGDNAIFNYVLVTFSDPDVSAPFITENVTEIVEELKKVEVVSSANFDCPENALSGLKAGLDGSLPNSIVYLFTDAPANDFEMYSNISAIILNKQITVNFIISDSCGKRDYSDDRYKVFTKISNLVNGLTYEIQKDNFNDILKNIKEEINSKHKLLKIITSESDKRINFNFDVDDSVTELKITMAGRDQHFEITNPDNKVALAKRNFTTDGIKILYFEDPKKGSWKFGAKDNFVIISVMSDLEFDFGFSIDIVDDKSETVPQPISEVENILSIFVPDPSQIDQLSKVSLLVAPMDESESATEVWYNLNRQSEELYTTDPFELPKNPFKIFLEGEDVNRQGILRTISSILYEDAGTAPEVMIEVENLEFYEEQNLTMQCNVKSLVPANIEWTFNGGILESLHPIQRNERILNIKNITYEQRGTYKCVAVNEVGCETEEVRVVIIKKPKLEISSSSSKMIENSSYMLTCQLNGTIKEQEIEYSWFSEDGSLVHNGGNTYSFVPIAEDNNKVIKCQAKCDDFTVDSLITLNISYAPRFLTGSTKNVITYGSKVRFDCSSTENPPKSLLTWNFRSNSSTKSIVIDGKNESIFEVQEAFEKDEGIYECLIGNELGEISRNFTISLTPKESPKIMPVKDVVLNETENAKIICECKNCLPITNYSWIFNNSRNYEIQMGQNEKENYFRTFIVINNTDESDSGSYQCQISNSLGEDKVTINVKIQTAPKIEKILVKGKNEKEINGRLNILEGEDIIIECLGTGHPPPKISWFNDNQKLSDDSILKITNATLYNEGEFECVTENIVRTVRRTIQMDVNFIPKRKSEANIEITVTENEEIELKCELIGKPVPEISWYLNSKQIEENEKYNISGNTLRLFADSDDSGLYKCKGMNEFGSAEVDFTVTVKSFPRILSPNDELVKVEINTQLKLSCDSTGYPVPQIKFVKNNIEISTESTLTIEAVAQSNAGSYHCYAENEVRSAEKIFYVSVIQKPLISSIFNNITLYPNQTKQLTCLAEGIPEPNYKWKLNNKELLSSENFINLDTYFESGKISCIAENSEGIAESYFYLEIINIPKLHDLAHELQTNFTIREGDDLELLCPVENYTIIKWTHNGLPFKVPAFKQAGKKLIIYNTKKSNSGLWTCSAYHTKNATNFSYKIVVLSPPIVLASWNFNSSTVDFDKNDADIDQKVFWKGENLVLNCTVDGCPVPNVEWRKGSILIGRGEVLSVDNLQLFHSDIYSCLSENKHGIVKKYFKVDILSSPHVNESAKVVNNVYGASGESVTIKCPIIGNPEPLFSWYREDELLEDEIENFLIIEGVKLFDEGSYRCLARNKYGKHNINFDLTLNEPAQILEVFEQEKTQKEFVTISCVTDGYPLPVISWILNGKVLSTTSNLKINEVLNGTDDSFLYFDGNGNEISYSDPSALNISSRDHYSKLIKTDKKSLQLDLLIRNNKDNLHLKKFYCNAFNALGQDEKSVETVYNQEPYIEEKDMPKLTEYKVLEHLPLQLTCMFDGYPVPDIFWYKDNIQIFDNETLKIVNDGKILNIPEAVFWLTGNYSCVGKNKIGTMQLTFDVLILSPPRIMTSPKISDSSNEDFMPENIETIEAIRGEDVILECSVESSPKAKIHWIKLNNFGSSNERILLDEESSIFTVQSIEGNEIYQCYANNSVGFIQKTFVLNVFYPPAFIDNKSSDVDLIVKLHRKLIMECKVDGFPEPQTYWSFNSKNITDFGNGRYLSSDDQVLRIINTNRNSEGKFTCISFNRFGQVQKSFNIKIDIPIQYSLWSKWSECSEFCGTNGTEFRTRTCILLDEIPSYNCTGDTLQIRKCNEFPCPINGGFSSWSDWSECPACYDVLITEKPKQNRSRSCDSPEPAYGGLNCVGDRTQERECEIETCQIDGGWSSWSDWNECPKCYDSLKSDKPKQNRTRVCDSPSPAHGGLKCQGSEIEEQECDIKACPVDGVWSSWSTWNVCPACYIENEGIPKQSRTRKCNSPSPQYGGSKCDGTEIEQQDCKEMKFCPINGGWSKWSDWSGCTAVSGHGTQYRIRYCNNPKPKYNGNDCIGLPQEKRSCEEISCDDDETIEATRSERLALPQHSFIYPRRKTNRTQVKCGRGYKANLQNRCIDIDECRECNNRKLCNKNEICINSIGSYRCREL
ncbi:hypothetical protein ACKWTF_009159 [Chironomus riparius]